MAQYINEEKILKLKYFELNHQFDFFVYIYLDTKMLFELNYIFLLLKEIHL